MEFPDLRNYDASQVTDKTNMSRGCNLLMSVTIGKFDVSKLQYNIHYLSDNTEFTINGRPWIAWFQ